MVENILNNLFNTDKSSPEVNSIGDDLLNLYDSAIYNLIESTSVSDEVISVYKKFVSMKQDAPESMKYNLFSTIRNFANEQAGFGNYLDSLILYRFLIVKSELISTDYYTVAELLNYLNLTDLSFKFIELYKEKEQNKPLVFLTLANFYNMQVKDYKTAIKYYEKYLEIDKTKSVIYKITANLYSKVYGRESLQQQIDYYNCAYNLNNADRTVLHALAFGYEKLGQKECAKKFYKELLVNNPTNIDYFNYGAFLISCGEFQEGHKYFRYRFSIDNENYKYPQTLPVEKKWDLESDISNKTLLIHYEQGFGDTFMYCRFLPQLKKYAKKLIFVVQDSLCDLIKNSCKISEGIIVVSDKSDLSNIEYDYHMALLDAPYVLKTETSSIPFSQGYLDINDNIIEDYAGKHFKQSKNLKVGISYSGDSTANYSGRDIDLNKFNILTDISGIDLYSLQYDEKISNSKIVPLGKTFNNFTDTAAAIKNMDLVITTDNVILNLAGALGVKTIALFNKETNYRWFKTTGENVGWYDSVKPLQVDYEDNWNYVFAQLVNILANK